MPSDKLVGLLTRGLSESLRPRYYTSLIHTFAHTSQGTMSNHQGPVTQATGVLVLLNGLPIVTERQWPLLAKFLFRKLRDNGPLDYNKICMPLDDQGTTFGYVV